MKGQSIQKVGRDDGQTLVEFSLVAVMFIVMLFAVVEMSRMILVYTTISNAAKAGARYAIVHGADRSGSGADGPSGPGSTTEVETVAKNYAAAGLLNTSNVNVAVSYGAGGNTPGSTVTVSVTYTYDPLIRYFSSILNRSLGADSRGVITF